MMTPAQRELWTRLETFAFDEPGATLTFARRLARENGWTIHHTEKVLREYRRFVFLAMEAGHPVSPSAAVDQAWHLHLTYTKSYWGRLCGEALGGRRLHHHPTKGGAGEAAKFDGQYERTQASYRRLFGAEPPADIWPAAETVDHAAAGAHRWVDTSKNWVVPKWLAWTAAGGTVAGLFALGAAGCSASQAGLLTLFDLPGPEFLGLFVALVVAGFLVASLVRHWICAPHDAPGDDEMPADDYETAYLAGGGVRVLQTALVSLHAGKAVTFVPGGEPGVRRAEPPQKAAHDVEVLAWGLIPEKEVVTIASLQNGLKPAFDKLETTMVEKGLFSAQAGKANRVAMAILLVPPALGIIKIFVGLARGRPVVFLVIGTLFTLVFTAAFFFAWRKARRSGRGGKALKQLRERNRIKSGSGKPELNPSAIPLGTAVALLGLAALPLYGYESLSEQLKKGLGENSGGGGCGTSCGGGGGGGDGGGGCGGCGGGGGD